MFGSIGKAIGGAVSGIIGLRNNNRAYNLALDQFNFSKDMARNQIQWRVEDAKKAGVHPMAALGLSPSSFSPVSIPSASGIDMNWLGELGQEADRAIQQGKTRAERAQAEALQDKLTSIQIRKGEADADLAETEAASARFRLQQQLFPSPPPVNKSTGVVDGQGDALANNAFGKDVHRLFNFGLHGNSGLVFVNPDIADSITESASSNLSAMAVREIENGNPEMIDDLIAKFPKHVQKSIARGEMRLTTIPGSGVYRAVPVGPDEEFDRYKIW